jgi:hypothetical protein
MKIGIAISTYSNEKTPENRFNVIKLSLDSLKKNIIHQDYETYVIIVVDGIIQEKHKLLLNNYNFNIHYKKENGGVAKVKNTSIRLLLQQKVDIGFLADDDVLYKKNFLIPYVNTMINGKIDHMGYCQVNEIVHPKESWVKMGYIKMNYNNLEIMKHGGKSVGCWLSFTPELIEKIGYFKVMEGKYGYEHINFTLRCINQKIIPYAIDIINPEEYISHIGFLPCNKNKFLKTHSIDEKYRISENNKNKIDYLKDLDQFYDCIE